MKAVMGLCLLLLCSVLLASEDYNYICTYGDLQRVIKVVYSGEGDLPCEVQYTKSSNTEVLWWAKDVTGFCESKARAFAEKQQGWGWTCDKVVPKGIPGIW
jgi:hypothetical protein